MADAPWHRGPWPHIRLAILERDGHLCQIRGPHCTGTATHVDHILSPTRGGAWYDHRNLRAACPTCNLRRPHPNHHRTRTRRRVPASRNW